MRKTMVGVAALCCASLGSAGEPWLPPPVAEMMAGKLYDRTKATAVFGAVPDERLRENARLTVDALSARFAGWGEKAVREHAPALRSLGLPEAKQPHLDAMARYFTCAGVYEVLHLRDAFAKAEQDERVLAAMAPTGFSMAMLYLRTPYLDSGGTDAQMEAAMTSPQMEPILATLQEDVKLLEAAYRECSPVVTWLMKE